MLFEQMQKYKRMSLATLAALCLPLVAVAEDHAGQSALHFDPEELDELIIRAIATFQIPGMAVGVIKDGEVVYAKGHGVIESGKSAQVNERTLFSIASNGKALTTAAIALLVDEGVLSWSDPVIKHLPQFRMYDPWVTHEFQIRDLLIHNSGLPIGAGDLMMFPSEGFTRAEIMHNLRYLKPSTSFRSEFAYDNLLYIVAGELVAAVSGMSYEDFIDERVLKPLGMIHCGANLSRFIDHDNVAKPHARVNGQSTLVEGPVAFGQQTVAAAAGGIYCSVESYLKWHDMLLRDGETADGEAFLTKTRIQEMTSIHTPINQRPSVPGDLYGKFVAGYGLGWTISDHEGYKKLWHTGADTGMVSANAFFPELNTGFVVLTNQQAVGARLAIFTYLHDIVVGKERSDWISAFEEFWQARDATAAQAAPDLAVARFTPIRPIDDYTGTYRDAWFGDIEIVASDGRLYFQSIRSEKLRGWLTPYKADIFVATWEDRSLEADAFVKFSAGFEGVPTSIEMKAVSPTTDFSYDFHDLDLQRLVSPD